MLISDGQYAVTNAQKRLAYSAWFLEQCLKYMFMHRLLLLKIIADGRTSFNNSFRRLMTGLLYSDDMGTGMWEACKHMLYGDQPDGTPHSNDQVKVWAGAELDSYTRDSGTKYQYDDWHEKLGTLRQQ